jgi:hypothetical protein
MSKGNDQVTRGCLLSTLALSEQENKFLMSKSLYIYIYMCVYIYMYIYIYIYVCVALALSPAPVGSVQLTEGENIAK